jgi:hypothetical protein
MLKGCNVVGAFIVEVSLKLKTPDYVANMRTQ